MRSSNDEGSISVYLVISFIVILSLLAGMLEAAGSTLARARVRLWLRCAADSVMGEYYGPLYEEYGLYAIDMGFGSSNADPAALEDMLAGYLPKQMDGGTYLTSELLGYDSIVDRESSRSYTQMTNEILHQIMNVESVELVGTITEELMAKLGLLDSGSKTARKLEKRLAAEEKLAEIDVFRMELMRLIDGVDLRSLDGYRIEDSFVKRLQTGRIASTEIGINNAPLWDSLKNKYVDATELLSRVVEDSGKYSEAVSIREKQRDLVLRLVEEYHASEARLIEYLNRQAELIEDEEACRSEQDSQDLSSEEKLEALQRSLSELKDCIEKQRELIEEQYARYMEQWEVLSTEESTCRRLASVCRKDLTSLEDLVQKTKGKLKEAEETVYRIISVQKAAKPLVEAYSLLTDEDDEILCLMRSYLGQGIKAIDTDTLLSSIDKDLSVIEALERSGALKMPTDEYHAVLAWNRSTRVIEDGLSEYTYAGMRFDYSQVSVKSVQTQLKEEVETGIKKLLSEGMLSLLLSGEDISDTQLDEEELPGAWLEKIKTGSCAEQETKNLSFYGTDPMELIRSIGSDGGISELFGEMLKAAQERLGVAVYVREHFKSYKDKNDGRTTRMLYEQEYLLTGDPLDSVNLASVAGQIMMLRLVPAAAYVFTDPQILAEAQTFALATMSFTGIPFLVSAVKYLILAVWAIEQAMVETSAIIRGKKVPVITSASSSCLSLHELIMMSPTLIRQKAESIPEGGVYLEYEDYLFVLMLCRGTASSVQRVLDMAQEDIRYAYDESFRICNCITGFRVGVEYEFTPILLSGKDSIAGRIMPTGYRIHEDVTVHY